MGRSEYLSPVGLETQGELLMGEDIDLRHFYAAYIFDQPQDRDGDIAAIVKQAQGKGYPARYWWLSEAVNLQGFPDRLIVCVHHPSFAPNAGMDLCQALREDQVAWDELEAASPIEYLQLGKFIRGLEDLRDSDGRPLFAHEDLSVVEWSEPHEEMALRLRMGDPVMDTLSPYEREKMRQALGEVLCLFTAVLENREVFEEMGVSLGQLFGSLAEQFTELTAVYETGTDDPTDKLTAAGQAFPFSLSSEIKGGFYESYVFENPADYEFEITMLLEEAQNRGYSTRYWWNSDENNEEVKSGNLLICVHHPEPWKNAGMDLFEAVKSLNINFDEVIEASADDYRQFGNHIAESTAIQTPNGVPLFPVLQPEQEAFIAQEKEPATDAVEIAFANWLLHVDEIILDMTGCSVADLPDINYRGLFESETHPSQAANAALGNAGFG